MLSSWHLSSSFTWNFPKSRHIWLGDLSIPWTAPNWRKQTPHGTRAAIKGAKRGEDQFSLHLNHQTRINTQFFHSWTISGWLNGLQSSLPQFFFKKFPPWNQNSKMPCGFTTFFPHLLERPRSFFPPPWIPKLGSTGPSLDVPCSRAASLVVHRSKLPSQNIRTCWWFFVRSEKLYEFWCVRWHVIDVLWM